MGEAEVAGGGEEHPFNGAADILAALYSQSGFAFARSHLYRNTMTFV